MAFEPIFEVKQELRNKLSLGETGKGKLT